MSVACILAMIEFESKLFGCNNILRSLLYTMQIIGKHDHALPLISSMGGIHGFTLR
jgi:hypothetical protein